MSFEDSARLQQTVPANVSASAGGEFASALDGGLSSPSRSAGSASLPPVTTESRKMSDETAFASSLPSLSGRGVTHVTSSDPSTVGLGGSADARAHTTQDSTVPGRTAETIESTVASQAHQSGLVAPQSKDDMNDATKHVDNLAAGIAGVALTAPLAAIEKVSPVLAEKVQAGVETAKSTLSSATSSAASAVQGQTQQAGQGQGVVGGAQQAAQNALETVKGYLPTALGGALGGKPADSTASSTSQTSTTMGGPTLTERATSAATSTKDSVASTAQAYLPASIVGGRKDESTSSTTSSTSSQYADLKDVEPTSTISASDVTHLAKGGSDDLASKGSTTEKSGLAPASFTAGGASGAGSGSSVDYKHPSAGAPMYTGSQAGSVDYKKDQSDFTPGEFAGTKHDTLTGSGRGVGPDPETKSAQTLLSSGGGLGSTAESDVPASSTGRGQPSADPKSGAAAVSDSMRATDITEDPTSQSRY
ncbi:hypothetical protein OIV83_005025 [Microbotryomycetes sp. JL201]|nr:hypothetical protein OIV83_005025 [Microbotryomycetes sp. JL201]